MDVAGEIVEVGEGVKKFKAGDKAVALLNLSVSAHSIPLLKLVLILFQNYLCMV